MLRITLLYSSRYMLFVGAKTSIVKFETCGQKTSISETHLLHEDYVRFFKI